MESTLRRTWAEINLDHLTDNFNAIRRQVGEKTRMMGVVKADAYGHGALRVARHLQKIGADYLAVSNMDEAEELRSGDVTLPILILGFTPAEQAEHILRLHVTQAVPNLMIARAYDEAAGRRGEKMKVHLKLDTGMGRLGFLCDEAHFEQSLQEVLEILHLPHLEVEGVFTHFSVADEEDAESEAFTRLQFARFSRMVAAAEERGSFRFALRHCCNGGGIACYPEYACDMVRCGILLYGSGPMDGRLGLKPVMTLKTSVSTIKDFDSGMSVSYGRRYVTHRAERIAVLPIGYADGLPRALSGRLRVLTPYGEAPQVGSICMDMCMVDVTELPDVGPGDEIEIFGAHQPADTAAGLAGTISYELLSAVSKRVPRYYYLGGACVDYNLQLLG
jgi:alanine racemase